MKEFWQRKAFEKLNYETDYFSRYFMTFAQGSLMLLSAQKKNLLPAGKVQKEGGRAGTQK